MRIAADILTRFALGRGIGQTLFLWFLGLAVVPFILIGGFFYLNVQNLLAESADRLLENVLQLKGEHLQEYLLKQLAVIKTQARYRSNLELLGRIEKAQEESKLSPHDFVRTPAWLELAEDAGYDLHVLQQEEEYYDIMLIDTDGNVVFSISQDEYLGRNIFHNLESPLGKACRRALAIRQPLCSDFQPHGLTGQQKVAFLVQVILDADSNPAGLIAFGLPGEHFNRIMQEGSVLGETGQSYIVGGDLLLRAPGRLHSGLDVLQQRIETDVVRVWRQQHQQGQLAEKKGKPETIKEQVLPDSQKHQDNGSRIKALHGGPAGSYSSYRGEVVRGRFNELPIFATVGLDWAVIAEMNTSETFKPAEKLHYLMLVAVLGGIAVLFITAGGIAYYIVFPIQRLSSWVRRVASGDLSGGGMEPPANEIGEVVKNFKEVIDSFSSVFEENTRALKDAKRLVYNLDNLPVPVFTLDMRFNITYINPAGAALAGFSPGDCIGLKCQTPFRSVLCQTENCCCEKIKLGGRTVSGRNIINAGGRHLPVEFTAVPIRNDKGEIEGVLVHLNDISEREKAMAAMLQQEWSRNGQIRLSNIVRGVYSLDSLCQNVIRFLAEYLDAQAGTIYLAANGKLTLAATHACSDEVLLRSEVSFGEGLAGQVALTQKTLRLDTVPEGYFPIRSFLGGSQPNSLLIVPFIADGNLLGVIELAGLVAFPVLYQEFLEQVAEYIAIAVSATQSRIRLTELLKETREQAMLLKSRQEELRHTNEELEIQTLALKASEKELQAQQEELRVTNEELEERTRVMEEQQNRIRNKNKELKIVQRGLEQKTQDLEAASRYKSEFLANMSHELRTPLNSMLLLSGILAANKEGTLTEKQTEYAATIHAAGTDLLKLINEILDLSKVEAGKITLNIENVCIADFAAGFERAFQEIANSRGLKFSIMLSDRIPETIRTDRLRAEQIVRNFLSNAFKFTEIGVVSLKIGWQKDGTEPEGLFFGSVSSSCLAISVSDTGIGIPADKQRIVFEEFRQADGTTTRKYGGTGLGLSISRRLAEVLGGAISLVSRKGEGSTFTLYLPLSGPTHREETRDTVMEREADTLAVINEKTKSSQPLHVTKRDVRLLLVIVNSPRLGAIIRALAIHRQFQVIIETTGGRGLELARQQVPDAIVLEMTLPDMDGKAVIECLGSDDTTSHIPVHGVTCQEASKEVREGARFEHIADEVSLFLYRVAGERTPDAKGEIQRSGISVLAGKKIMLVDDDMRNLFALTSILEDKGMRVVAAKNGREGLARLEENPDIALVLMDIMLPELDGYETIGEIRRCERFRNLPVIALTAKTMKEDRVKCLEAGASDYMAKPVQAEKLLSLIQVWLSQCLEYKHN